MKIETVLFDWAGTVVDFGCFAPVRAFQASFEQEGLHPTLAETRAPMGMAKREHIAAMLRGERLRAEFVRQFGREPGGEDIDRIYRGFEPVLFETLPAHADVMPGVVETVSLLRNNGIKIGSTTGYTAAMMEVVVPLAKENGYAPDSMVCPDDVGQLGRPYPYMIWRNLERLGAADARSVIKIGDTRADILEGLHAGCISVGVLAGSSAMGLSREEAESLPAPELERRREAARSCYREAGAHYILDRIADLPALIATLEE